MKNGNLLKTIIMIMIFAAALAIGAAAFIYNVPKPTENIYSLSEERMFGITNLDEVVVQMRNALKARSRKITISINLKGEYMDDISPLVKELMELAFLPTGIPDEGDYLRFQIGGYTYSYGHISRGAGYRYTIEITPEYYSSSSQEADTTAKVAEILKQLPVSADDGDYEKVQAVYDYLTENVSYDTVHKNNDYHTLKSTAYGALINHSATCQGYAVSAYRLLMELGVDCRVIRGNAINPAGEEVYHAWNEVRIDGEYYNIDATWGSQIDHDKYFLTSFTEDHIPDPEYR